MADTTREMYRGDTLIFPVQVVQVPAGAAPGSLPVPQNVSGWTFWCTGKRHYSDPDSRAVWQVTTDGGGIAIVNAAAGMAQIVIPASATLNFPDADDVVVYDVQARDLNGDVFTVERGTVTVHPDVTRAIS